ncbi:MAG: hypothetical protein R2873_30540 [Caldilineaceae bacterium]
MIYTGNTWYALYSHATDLNTGVPADTGVASPLCGLRWDDPHYLMATICGLLSATVALDTTPNTAMVVGLRPDLNSTSFDGLIDDVRPISGPLSSPTRCSGFTFAFTRS